MFSISLRRADHVRQYSISAQHGAGWDVKFEEDCALTRHIQYHDWHRVERTLAMLRQEVDELLAQGWEIQSTNR